jgi:hypothetical protein
MTKPMLDDEKLRRMRELELVSKADRSPEQQKEYARLATWKSRRKAKSEVTDKRLTKIAESAETREQFWQANRTEVSPEQLREWLDLQERVQDQWYWATFGWEDSPENETYVSLQEGIDLMDQHVKEHGVIKERNFTSDFLNSFNPSWAVWTNESDDVNQSTERWPRVKPYWKDSQRLAALIAEGKATRVWCLYGIRISHTEYALTKWKCSIEQHQSKFDSAGWHRKNEFDDCYLCRFEKKHGTVTV